MVTREGVADAGMKLLTGVLGVVFFLAVVVGGGVCRTDCVTGSRQVIAT